MRGPAQNEKGPDESGPIDLNLNLRPCVGAHATFSSLRAPSSSGRLSSLRSSSIDSP